MNKERSADLRLRAELPFTVLVYLALLKSKQQFAQAGCEEDVQTMADSAQQWFELHMNGHDRAKLFDYEARLTRLAQQGVRK